MAFYINLSCWFHASEKVDTIKAVDSTLTSTASAFSLQAFNYAPSAPDVEFCATIFCWRNFSALQTIKERFDRIRAYLY